MVEVDQAQAQASNPKLDKLRALMEERGLAAFICFHMDQHNSEYIAACDERIAFISGFTGSNGLVVVTKTDARMWTDGRYYLAASKQLEAGYTMMKMERGLEMWFEWTAKALAEGDKIGMDFSQYPAAPLDARSKYFADRKITIESTENLVDLVWGDERPARPTNPVKIQEVEFAGKTSLEKQLQVQGDCKDKGFQRLLVTTLDDICWITNLRGTDIDFNPVFFANLIIELNEDDAQAPKTTLYIQDSKVEQIKEYLDSQNISTKEYEEVEVDLKQWADAGDSKIGVHKSTCNAKMLGLIKEIAVDTADNITQHAKAAKNVTEQAGMRACNVRDCAAIMKYFAYLEEELQKDDHDVTEYTGARYLDNLRTKGQYHQGPSFDTISSIGANGAVIHYKPDEDTAVKLNRDEIYLLDSGGQYLDGTTDITRTTHFGGKEPTQFQKEAYTRVLMGNLDLERIVWPSDSTIAGGDMDILARKSLWEAGLDFKHGTGHGVGSYLNVHEGPVGVSRGYKTKFVEGHCVSDEPGYYEDGQFGIRIENVIMVQKSPHHENFFMFENLTLAPYERDLIEKDLLAPRTVRFIDDFHQKCLAALTPYLQDDERALAYVTKKCQPL